MTTQAHTQDEELIAREEGGADFPVHPEDQYPAVCIDVIDRGKLEKEYNGEKKIQHKITLRFFCGEYTTITERETGNEVSVPLWVDAWFTLSLSEKSKLRPFLENWRGVAFTPEQLKGFNVAKLLGAPAFVQLKHNESNGRTYCNIASIMRLPKGMEAPKPPTDYVRVRDRPPKDEEHDTDGSPWTDPNSEPLPF